MVQAKLIDNHYGKKKGVQGIRILVQQKTPEKTITRSLTIHGQTLDQTHKELYFYYLAKYHEEVQQAWKNNQYKPKRKKNCYYEPLARTWRVYKKKTRH